MVMDLNTLSFGELLELKHVINLRLHHLESEYTKQRHMNFCQGDEVNFTHRIQGRQTGILLEINASSATVISQTGQKWQISPNLLKKIVAKP